MKLQELMGYLSLLPGEWDMAIQEALKVLRKIPRYSWVGIYVVEGDSLVLRAWEGPRATEHVKIKLGEGVCGSAAVTGKVENVPDVGKDQRYIACFPETKSEIVVPIKVGGKVVGVIDIDSDVKYAFKEDDERLLVSLASELAKRFGR